MRLSLGLLRREDGLQQFVVKDLSHPESLLGERLVRAGMVLRRRRVVRAENVAKILNPLGYGFCWIHLKIFESNLLFLTIIMIELLFVTALANYVPI